MAIESYLQGSAIRLEAELQDYNGTPVAGNNVRLLMMPPSRQQFEVPLAINGWKVVAVVPLPEAGPWAYRFEATDPYTAAEEGRFSVTPSRLRPVT